MKNQSYKISLAVGMLHLNTCMNCKRATNQNQNYVDKEKNGTGTGNVPRKPGWNVINIKICSCPYYWTDAKIFHDSSTGTGW
jgi:hypothetical protein